MHGGLHGGLLLSVIDSTRIWLYWLALETPDTTPRHSERVAVEVVSGCYCFSIRFLRASWVGSLSSGRYLFKLFTTNYFV